MNPPPALPMYQAVMGDAFDRLAPAVREFHCLAGRTVLHGQVETEAPQTRVAQLLARLLGTPRQHSRGAIRFELDAGPQSEIWTRHFPQRVMRSQMRRQGTQLVEQLGAVRLFFDLTEREGALVMQLRSLRFLGLPCPHWLMPRVHAVETGQGGTFHFEVGAALPWIGRVAGYRGRLELPASTRKTH